MEREACVCDHGYERSDLCAEIINNNNNNILRLQYKDRIMRFYCLDW